MELAPKVQVLEAEASRGILEFRVSETPFPGVFKRYFSTVGAMLLRQNTRETGNYAPEMSYVFHDMAQFERFTDIYIQCHSPPLFDIGTYFLLAVTVDGNESRRLKEWLTSRQFLPATNPY